MGHAVMWYEWDSLELFNQWHDGLCASLGFPLVGINQGSGLPDPNAQMTTAYTTTIEVEGKFIAIVETEYGEGLTPTDLREPKLAIG